MAAARNHDFDIRATIVRDLLAHGIPSRDIDHEITLDTNSSGGRADIVFILSDAVLAGIEIKSASDNLARCVEQLDRCARAFDAPLFVVDHRLARRLERPDREGVRGRAASCNSEIWPLLTAQPSSAAAIDGMARPLWRSEIEALIGQPTNRDEGLDRNRRNSGLDELRTRVIDALRKRVQNKWEEVFWKRFDALASDRVAGSNPA